MARTKNDDGAASPQNENGNPQRLLTEDEAATILNVSPHTLRSWRCGERRQGPRFLKLGARAVRYQQSALIEYLSELERASKAG